MARPGTLLEAGRAGAKRAQRASLAVFGLGLIGVVAWLAIGGSGTAAPIARSGRTPATAPQPCQNAPASFATSSRQQCPPYADIVQAATEREKDRPQLNQAQLLWISSMTQGAAAARRRPANLLVFGVGYDSDVWTGVNCGGRTAFLENLQPWIDRVVKDLPGLEVHPVAYKGRMAEADTFFGSPWLMDVPPAVNDTCWDVYLVDAPQGFNPSTHPGARSRARRMESSYYAVQHALRCVATGQLEEATVLLHDVQRRMEQRILRETFVAPAGSGAAVAPLGVIKGEAGDLAAFRVAQA